MEEILKNLSPVQQEAVLYNEGPSLVIAGAGSGKTRVLTYKIAALLEQGYDAHNILAITFTNKAANEMKCRIQKIVGGKTAYNLWMGTFHSIFSRILRKEADLLSFSNDFTIYDTNDTRSKINEILKELGLKDNKSYATKKIQNRISSLKNSLITPTAYAKNVAEKTRDREIPKFGEIYRQYMNDCHRANAMDFDDLLLYTNVLFRDFPEILEKYQDLFKFVLVDEYQDTNFSQHAIVTRLCQKHHKLCVVGDDAQSIYSFRGANISNILQFKNIYPEYKLFKLEQNYRSTQNIVNAANSLIAKNEKQIKKNTFSKNEIGSKIKVLQTDNEKDESEVICDIIRADLSKFKYNDTAILYRTKAQSRSIEDAFRKNMIPYKIYGGMSFYDQKVVKDIFAYFRLIINHNDEEAFKRTLKFPRKGIGEKSVDKIRALSKKNDVPLWNIISDPLKYNVDLSAATIKRIVNFRQQIEQLSAIVETANAHEIANRVLNDFNILKELELDTTEDGKEDIKVAQEVLNGIASFSEENENDPSIANYLQNVSLMTDPNESDDSQNDAITLMTIHSAKGLEFKNVIISGLEQELFPSSMAIAEEGIEEERRLFYVAITRAETNCFITYAQERFQNGQRRYPDHSQFLDEIDSEYLDLPRNFNSPSHRYGMYSKQGDFDFDSFKQSRTSNVSQSFNQNSRTQYSHNNSDRTRYHYEANIDEEGNGFDKNDDYNNRYANNYNYGNSTYGGKKYNDNIEKVTIQAPQNFKKLPKSDNTSETKTGFLKSLFGFDKSDNKKNNSGFEIGNHVRHERFGEGVIQNIEAMNDDYKLTILFNEFGEKKILRKYANLTLI